MAWWNSSWDKKKKITLTGGSSGAQTNYQIKLAVTYDSDMKSDFSDLRFTNGAEDTLIDAWLESKIDSTSAVVWVEFPTTPANTVEQYYYMYYGNGSAASDWDGAATFLQYHGTATASFLDSLVVDPASIVYEGKIKRIGTSNILWGLSKDSGWATEALTIQSYTEGNLRYGYARNNGSASSVNEAPAFTDSTWVKAKITCDGSNVHCYVDDNEIGAGISSNIPNENLGLGMLEASGSSEQEWSFARKYAANPATYAFSSEESQPTGNPYWYYNMLRRRN